MRIKTYLKKVIIRVLMMIFVNKYSVFPNIIAWIL